MKNSLYENLYARIANDIRTGKLIPGTKLPSVRKYSEDQGVSRNTVLGAYNLLLAEGYIVSKEKSGYYVANFIETLPEAPKRQEQRQDKPQPQKKADVIDLSANLIDSSLFPYSILRQLYRETLSDSNRSLLEQSGPFMGEESLRRSICGYVYAHKGISCDVDQVIIGNGTSYHLQVLPRLFSHHPVFIMENPGFGTTNEMVSGSGASMMKVSVDEEGASIQDIRAVSKEIGRQTTILHVSPSHQFPLGTTMTAPRRSSILKWMAEDENRYIVEDDYDSDFRYNGHPIPSLQSMDNCNRVIHIGTFSRTLTPSLRLSYMILPKDLANRYRSMFSSYPCPVSRIDQNVIARFIDNGHFERHINRMRRIYRTRRNSVLTVLQKQCPQAEIRGEEAGLHFIAKFPMEENKILEMAKAKGLVLNGTGTGWIVIGYAHLSDKDIEAFSSFLESLAKRSID